MRTLLLAPIAILLMACTEPPTGTTYSPVPSIPNTETPTYHSPVVAPVDLAQYIENRQGQLVAVPFTPGSLTARTTIKVIRPDQRPTSQRQHIRDSYGGSYPYVVVHAQERYLIVNQAADVLVVGLPNPERRVLPAKPGFVITPDLNGQIIARPLPPGAPVEVIYQKNRLNITVETPPGVPRDVLKRISLGQADSSSIEATYSPDRRYAYPLTTWDLPATDGGQPWAVYRYNQP